MTDELMPCPKCNHEVQGVVTGGQAAYGCGEYNYQIECACGIMFDTTRSYETPEEAEAEGIREWNTRYKRTCRIIMLDGSPSCSECKAEMGAYNDRFCGWCGAEVISE